ncbi:lipopolysaccharide biosynthesis protein [Sinirhodobacter populi]|uniref:Lipopolysaccharide biosynthesis protein n=1 Tax=Paenirhodobacter populi TaxID=2306993 RepID=A0A443KAX0_9RHOB|nr:lipopolysaccharide biosynthesis protein [Sinirhodobacter populi]RWR29846.1 lipopolysaccharide biosynthesis protein [Sinirhodobacter populi]
MTSDIRFYLTLFWRRLPLFLLVFLPIAVASIFIALSLPPIYSAQMRLVVESAQIPGTLAQSTVDVPAREQLQLFETRLMTRDNLLDVANRVKPIANQDKMSSDEIVRAMRAATKIVSSTGRDQATLMTVSFESQYPERTVQVLDSYLTFILNEDAQYRSQRAGQTQEFFQQEVDRLSGAMSEQSARIVAFKNQNSDALPDSLDYHRQLLLSLQDRINQLDRDRADLEEQKRRLSQAFELTGRVGSTGGTQLSPEQQRLQTLKAELAELESVYASNSPRVVSLRNRINQLETNLAAQSGQTVTGESDPAKAVFDLQMADLDTKLKQAQDQSTALTEQMTKVQDQIDRTPGNAVTLESLQRDFDNMQAQYNRAADGLSRASTGERIETLSRGQRMSVVERPSVPTEPIKPNRKRMVMLGVFAGLAAGIGLIIALDMFSGTIKRSKDLVTGLGIVPMVTIPLMRSREEVQRTRFRQVGLSLMIGVVLPVFLWLIHTYYMPFDELASKIAARIGLNL